VDPAKQKSLSDAAAALRTGVADDLLHAADYLRRALRDSCDAIGA
jgi:hypothetical protein